MRLYLLDTNTASHIIKGDIPRVRERLVAVPLNCIAVSAVTQAELRYGVAKRNHPRGLAARVSEFLARVTVLPWTALAADSYAELRVACEAGGVTLAPLDLMIAAHAKSLTLAAVQTQDPVILVTRDSAFTRARVAGGLLLEDWTQ